jgi:hypothetical protein
MKKPPVCGQEVARWRMLSALTNNHHQKLHVPQCSLDLAKLPAETPTCQRIWSSERPLTLTTRRLSEDAAQPAVVILCAPVLDVQEPLANR